MRSLLLYIDAGPRHARHVIDATSPTTPAELTAACKAGLLRLVRDHFVVTCKGSHYLGTFSSCDM